MSEPSTDEPFAHLKRRASERADRTLERLRAGIEGLHVIGRKITAESIKDITRDLEPGSAGLSFQVIAGTNALTLCTAKPPTRFRHRLTATTGTRDDSAVAPVLVGRSLRRMTPCSDWISATSYDGFERWRLSCKRSVRCGARSLTTSRRCAPGCFAWKQKSCFYTLSEMERSHEVPADIRDRRRRIAL